MNLLFITKYIIRRYIYTFIYDNYCELVGLKVKKI